MCTRLVMHVSHKNTHTRTHNTTQEQQHLKGSSNVDYVIPFKGKGFDPNTLCTSPQNSTRNFVRSREICKVISSTILAYSVIYKGAASAYVILKYLYYFNIPKVFSPPPLFSFTIFFSLRGKKKLGKILTFLKM